MKYAIETFGCKVNQYESDSICESLNAMGFTFCLPNEHPDVFIINSCTVTENSNKKAKHSFSKFKNKNPSAITAIVGCFPQAFPEEAKKLGADIVIGTADKSKLPQFILDYARDKNIIQNISVPNIFENFSVPFSADKTRAFIKIEDGCDRFCSYCIIPKARGRVRSKPLSEIAAEAEKQAENGHKEIVLVGVNLSCYGKDLGLRLVDAVLAVCNIPSVLRVRLSSLEPELITDEDIAKMAKEPKLCPHFHLSLQSGCDETLLRMNRHYNTAEYERLVKKLRSSFKNAAITTDIMVGFVGETDKEFEKTLLFAEKMQFSKIHVFTYSIRAGTAAENFSDHVSDKVKANRYKRLSELDKQLHESFLKNQIDKTAKVLLEKRTSENYICGLSENYTNIKIYDKNLSRFDAVSVKITGVENEKCIGEILK